MAVIGATGVVGRTMLTVLAERKVEIDRLFLVASDKSAGQILEFAGENHTVVTVDEAMGKPIDIALFSAGKELSKAHARSFADKGAFVIDNSSAWRMDIGARGRFPPTCALYSRRCLGCWQPSQSPGDYRPFFPDCQCCRFCG